MSRQGTRMSYQPISVVDAEAGYGGEKHAGYGSRIPGSRGTGSSAAYASSPDAIMRRGFLRKVLGLVTAQLLATALVAGSLGLSAGGKAMLVANPWLLTLSMVASIAIMLVLAFSDSARRNHPTNLILLGAFTLAESVVVGAITATYSTQVVVLGFAITAAVSAALTLYALQTKYDFTMSGGMLFSALLTLLVTSILGMFFPISGLRLAIAGCGALVFSAYIVYDVQLVAAGEHAVKVSPDEYVLAAINIYLDVINLFLYILQILRDVSDRN